MAKHTARKPQNIFKITVARLSGQAAAPTTATDHTRPFTIPIPRFTLAT